MSAAAEARGEHPGCGPEWACDQFGYGDHDYNNCPKCLEWFATYMAAKASLVSTGLLPLA